MSLLIRPEKVNCSDLPEISNPFSVTIWSLTWEQLEVKQANEVLDYKCIHMPRTSVSLAYLRGIS